MYGRFTRAFVLCAISAGAVAACSSKGERSAVDSAKAAYARHRIPWYRTDQNGTVTIRSPGTSGGGYTVTVERGTTNASGPSDRRSYQADCAGM